jgi:hypothetical protein
MMFLLAYIGAPPTIGSSAASAEPISATLISALAPRNLNLIMAETCSFRIAAGLGLPSAVAASIVSTGDIDARMQKFASIGKGCA